MDKRRKNDHYLLISAMGAVIFMVVYCMAHIGF